MADSIDDLLPETGKPNILKLTYIVIFCNFLAATQDIAVRKNVGFVSTCASVSQIIGITLSAVSLILFTSEDFSNKYLRITPSTRGIMNMRIYIIQGLFLVLAILFVAITALIAIFKNEKDFTLEDNEIKLNTFQNYILLWDILKLPSIRILAIALLTWKIGLSPSDNVVNLKLIDVGVPKDNIIIIQTGMYIIEIIVPVIAAKYTAGPKPMSIYLNIVPIKLLWNFSFLIFIYCASKLPKNNGIVDIPMYFYWILLFIKSINLIQYNIMITALIAFYCRISDDRFGGRQSAKLVLYSSIDLLTVEECTFDSKNNCSTSHLQNISSYILYILYVNRMEGIV
ncbi:hypothetical protein AGLY_004355 [Aphis glycines]|uniref:Uncharacterized protein n=1 Tax=Aphis glycines TaxID=307491 RepID=A0A6G0TZ72_APHGL|nr:hypothetical protein AGLY_004355 [Aphis glycines]